MTAAVETMAYAKSGGVPWHGMGHPVKDGMTPTEMLKAAKINWTVSKRPAGFKSEKTGKFIELKDEFALVRDSDEQKLSMVGATWKPVQNEKAIEFFSKFTKAGHMIMETAGSLWNGRYVWALARIGKDFRIGKSDEMRGYLLLASPHVFGRSLLLQTTAIRVVCWNTFCMAVGADMKGKGEQVFRLPHSMEFDDSAKKKAEECLGLSNRQMDEFKEAATLLSKKRASDEKVEAFFCDVMEFDPKAAKKKKDGEVKEPRMIPLFRQALVHAPGQNIATAMGTWWGAFNAVTNVIDHSVGRDRETALKAAWVGSHADLKRRAFTLALDGARASKTA